MKKPAETTPPAQTETTSTVWPAVNTAAAWQRPMTPASIAALKAEAQALDRLGLQIITVIPEPLPADRWPQRDREGRSVLDKNGNPRPAFVGKNPSHWVGRESPRLLSHAKPEPLAAVLAKIDTAAKHGHPIGLGVIPSDRLVIVDLDAKNYDGGAIELEADYRHLIAAHPELARTRTERTPSGGIHIYTEVADGMASWSKGSRGRRCRFTTSPGGPHRGEVLSGTRISVTAPTAGSLGAYRLMEGTEDYAHTLIKVPNLGAIGITPHEKPATPQQPIERPVERPGEPCNGEQPPPHLRELLRCHAAGVLRGERPYGEDRSSNMTGFLKELYGLRNWLDAERLPYAGSVDELTLEAAQALDIEDKLSRVIDTIDASACTWGSDPKASRGRYDKVMCGGWPAGDGADGFTAQGRGDQQQERQQQRQPDPEPLTYTQLIAATLEAVREGKADAEMGARAEIMARFRRSDSQITKALIDLLTTQESGAVNRSTYGAVDLERTAGMDWLIEGFIPERDQVLIYGEAGAGKTTAAVGLAFAVIDGTGFLDRASRATQGSVLFIASDSGADPLKAALQSMGLMDHPALNPDAEHRLIVWAHDADQGRLAWDASLRGCIALLDFIRRERPALVIIDSAKAVTSKADLNYCDNAPVTALLTFAKEVLCAHCSIAWLHHDGTAKGSAAGAKAWKEIPSMVHAIEHVEMGGSGDDKGGGGPRNEPWKCERMRWWKVRKCRMGTGREFQFELDEGTGRPALIPAAAKTVVQDARAGIVDELWRAWQEGLRSLSRRELIDAMRDQHSYSGKTTDNNLSRMVRARHPEVCRLSIPRGHYKLAPRVVEVLAAAAAQTDTPLITSLLHGKEQGKKPVRESDVVTSREVPEGTRRELSDEPAQASEFPRENLGNYPPASDRNGSGPVPSHEVFTPRARGASRQCLKSLWPDPWQQSA
jgi:hypothetical protein